MKTTVKFKLRASTCMPKRGPLVIHVTRHRATRTMTTPYVLFPGEWDEKEQSIVLPENIPTRRKRELTSMKGQLKKDLKELIETVKMLETRGDYTSQEVIYRFQERKHGQMFCAYIFNRSRKLREDKRFGTAHIYEYAAFSFLKFLNGADVGMNQINALLMKDYERHLISEDKTMNTVSCYMRSLRAAYKLAIREEIFVVKKGNENPFSEVFTGNEKTKKRAITSESISKLIEVELPENKEGKEGKEVEEVKEEMSMNSLSSSREAFLFSFYTQGMSFADMVNLKKENIKDSLIQYRRKKTNQLITIELEDCMKKIIDRYASPDSEFIFPVLRGYKGIKESEAHWRWKQTGNALAAFNRNLQKLAVLAGISEHLTSYCARHSWATIASQENIPLATISRCLGHESEKTTRIYISQTDYSDVGRANRQILSRFVV